ncbi:pentatricopeptide repeat-containing protein At4g25270, chloroplastic [Apium graveolens]|uniref:pentatricopeptide repeat-containing protein At4g25270, chloroplastic n=1 Tax=Apium graveolens TaxID=4045 RepID=UPI003D79F167
MFITLQYSVPHTILSVSHSLNNNKTNKHNSRRNKKRRANQLSIQKTSPAPLIINHKTNSRTKIEALDAVVKDLETSVNNGIQIDAQTFCSLLESCYNLQGIDYVVRIHRIIPEYFLRRNVGISCKLIRMYAVSGLVDEAHQVFDRMCQRDVYAFPWNALISGYAELGQFDAALALYFQMVEDGVEPDGFTFPRVLKACGGIGMIHVGEEVHRHIIRLGLRNDGYILNGLVDMYAKCGDIVKARKLFDGIVCKNLVSWNIMLTGYIRHELLHEALHVFQLMIKDAFEPDSVAISTILACGMPRKFGAQIHGRVLRRGAESYLSVANSLIVLYSNNNRLDCATWLFDQMYERDVVSWNSIISAYCKRSEALLYFESMRKTNIFPDRVTFVSLLSTCAHLGMVKDGDMLFTMMRDEYKITPVMEHYACMVNLYGRAGMIEEAYDMIMNQMEIKAGPTVWGALLYACYLHGNVDVGEIAAASLFELESDNEHNFEILMNIYKNSGRLEGVQRIKLMIEERGLDL